MTDADTSYAELAAHRDAMIAALSPEIGPLNAERAVDTLLNRIQRLEEADQG